MIKRQSLLLVTACMLFFFVSHGQNSAVTETTEPYPKTEVIKHFLNDNVVEYSFHSNKILLEQNKERWEYRFKLAYPEIKEINLNTATQEVTVSFPGNHEEETFSSLLKRFNCVDFIVVTD